MKLLLLVLRDGCGARECGFLDYLLLRGDEAAAVSGVSLRRPLKEFPVIGVHALSAWKFGALFLYDLVSGSLFLGIWVLLVECGTLDSSGDDFVRGCMLGSTVGTGFASVLACGRISHNFYVHVDSDPDAFFLHSV